MHRVSETIGLPIIGADTGRQLGKVRDVWFASDWTIFGFVTAPRRWWSPKAKVIRWADTDKIGRDGVMVRSKRAVSETAGVDEIYSFCLGKAKLKDLEVVTLHGDRLGTVTDVYFNPIMGNKVIGFELSDGLISDLIEGRQWLPVSDGLQFGEHMLLVPE